MVYLGCRDFARLVGVDHCCSSCHIDDWDYGYNLAEFKPPPNKRGVESGVVAHVCCGFTAAIRNIPRDMQRSVFAAACWISRIYDRRDAALARSRT